jgi:predicted RNase H-like nuclease (RuvC/YqgF family)
MNTHEIRELRFKIKQLSRQNGQQGDTIHRLRAELAEVRELNSKIERGELRRLERFEISAIEQLDRDRGFREQQGKIIHLLKEKLDIADIECEALREKLEVND